ncbi:MAG: ATP-binding cassette domain-containing protein [Firmicutes bacterium]|nr:ATP-binding cassette domain-containing protein [Bacillota bacterium]
MVELQNVSKSFANVQAVKNISFTAREGEIFGLLGPNGAGKSTTIRMMLGIYLPDSGAIYFNGKRLVEKDKNRIGYLPEERGLYKQLKVNDVLLYLAELKGKKRKEVQPRIDYLLEEMDLLSWKERKVQELSKGMSQKIQFISTIAHDPEIIFLDEPFSGLDPVSSDRLLALILNLKKEGITVILSTHIMDQAERLCDRILLINHGQEVLSGTMEEIKAKYGRRTIKVEFDGNGDFISSLSQAVSVRRYPRWAEIDLKPGIEANAVLSIIMERVSILKYELSAPTLHSIFVREIGDPEAKGGEQDA